MLLFGTADIRSFEVQVILNFGTQFRYVCEICFKNPGFSMKILHQ